MRTPSLVGVVVLAVILSGCASQVEVRTVSEQLFGFDDEMQSPAKAGAVGFEIIEVVSRDELRAWISVEIDQAGFDDLDLPVGWIKNQPRESEPDFARFLRSPDSPAEGEYLVGDAFGYDWQHAATIVDSRVELDEEGLLGGSLVRKYHELVFVEGRDIVVLVSPEADAYVRVTRDANRTVEDPSIPMGWRLETLTLEEPLRMILPEYTTVIRADNEDSFQGPVAELEGML